MCSADKSSVGVGRAAPPPETQLQQMLAASLLLLNVLRTEAHVIHAVLQHAAGSSVGSFLFPLPAACSEQQQHVKAGFTRFWSSLRKSHVLHLLYILCKLLTSLRLCPLRAATTSE